MRGIDVQDIGAENPIIYQDGFRIWPWKEVEDAATQPHKSQDVSCETCDPISFQ